MTKPDLGPNFRVLERVPLTADFAELEGWKWLVSDDVVHDMSEILAIVDFETTGLDKRKDEVIEMGLVLVGVHGQDNLTILGVGNWLNQPTQPISAEVTEITGITAEMVAGKALDMRVIREILAYAEGMVAHNADFDRGFFDRYFGEAALPWYCTSKGGDIDWKLLGQKSAGLENLLTAHGYFYDAHRAVIDCIATAFLLRLREDALGMMFDRGLKTQFRIKAIGAPFSVKDQLKEAGYRWNIEEKHWWIQTANYEEKDKQLAFLNDLYFCGKQYAEIEQILPIDKYRSGK
jgi:DNA polymerase-3 subunit epsilon